MGRREQRARRANERHGSRPREVGERLSALEQSRGCARGCVRRVRSCAADGKALVRHRALLVFRTVRGRSRADPTDPPPRRHNTAGTKRRLKMRSSGPRASTRARRRSARACLGACPRATCAFRRANISFPPNVDHPRRPALTFLALSIHPVSLVAESSSSSRSDTSRACSTTKGRCWTCARP